MKSLITLAALAATTVFAFAEAPAKDMKGHDAMAVQTITQLEQDWAVAIAKADIATIEKIAAPEWMISDPDGVLSSRAKSDEELKTGVYKCEAFKIDEMKVSVVGHTAIVFGLETEKSTYNGKDSSGQYRYTDVFVKRDKAWVAVATHVSKVAKS